MINKNVMAVAVAAALAAPVAAFAQASNVQIYGTLDMSVMNTSTSSTTAQAALATTNANVSGQSKVDLYSQSSRLGFKGTEDLGNGLKAWFQVENGLNLDGRQNAMTGAWAGRNSALGLEGAFGNVFVGIWDTPYKQRLTGSMSSYGGSWLGHSGMLLGGGADSTGTVPNAGCDNLGAAQTGNNSNAATQCGQIEGNTTSFHRRLSNSINYVSPNMSGFQAKLAYSGTGAKVDAITAPSAQVITNNPTLWSMDIGYAAGPAAVGVAYERHNGFRAASGATTATGSITSKNDASDTATQLYGSYDFGVVKVQANWEKLSYGDTGVTANPGGVIGAVNGTNHFDRSGWFLGLSAPVGKGRAYGGYSKTDGNKGCGTLGVTAASATAAASGNAGTFLCGSDTGATAYTLGYEYNLSKRTQMYVTAINVSNKQFASFMPVVSKPGVNGTATFQTGQDLNAVALGMRHSF